MGQKAAATLVAASGQLGVEAGVYLKPHTRIGTIGFMLLVILTLPILGKPNLFFSTNTSGMNHVGTLLLSSSL